MLPIRKKPATASGEDDVCSGVGDEVVRLDFAAHVEARITHTFVNTLACSYCVNGHWLPVAGVDGGGERRCWFTAACRPGSL